MFNGMAASKSLVVGNHESLDFSFSTSNEVPPVLLNAAALYQTNRGSYTVDGT